MYLRYTTEAGECVLLSASLFYKLLKTSPLAGRFFFFFQPSFGTVPYLL